MTKKTKGKRPGTRALARLLAVQALYLLRMNEDANPAGVVGDFKNLTLGNDDAVPLITQVDEELFSDLVLGVTKQTEAIRKDLDGILKAPWTYGRLEAVLASILDAGVYELKFRIDIPRPVIINEYVNITHSFYQGKEPGFVNGILDELAKRLRA